MKVIRQLKPVSVYNDYDHGSEDSLTLDELDSEPGYFEQVIRPMLMKGHEGELINWLKTSGLIPQYQTCKNADQHDNCKKPLSWYSSRTMDHYQWKCLNCSRKYSIRENSVFRDIKCNIKHALRLILGWCKGNDVEMMCNVLGVRKQVVNSVFRICTNIANKYIKNNIQHWQLGGPNTIVIIDVYPEVYNKYNNIGNEINGKGVSPILCIAEVKENPPRYWFELISRKNKKEEQNLSALTIVEKIVQPGSIIVANLNSSICSYDSLQSLKHLYPIIVSVDGLQRHNTPQQNVINNLSLVWKQAVEICDCVQSNMQAEVQSNLTNVMWQRKFGREAFEVLLNLMHCGEI